MKEIKFLILILITAAYTSSWWAAAWFGHGEPQAALWMLPGAATFGLIILAVNYLSDHWKEGK